MKTHEIKLNIEFCDAVLNGEKKFEVRYNDRGYNTGDLIKFIPYDDNHIFSPCTHEISKRLYQITYILNGWGLKNGYVAFAIEEV